MNLTAEMSIFSRELHSERRYWGEKFAGFDSPANFPADIHGEGKEFPSDEVVIPIDQRKCARLTEIANNDDSRLLAVVVSLTAILLRKYSGNDDLSIGVPVEKQQGLRNLPNKVLPLRLKITGRMSLKEVIYEVWKTLEEAIQYQSYPAAQLLRDLQMNGQGPAALFSTAVVLDNIQETGYLEGWDPDCIFGFRREGDLITGLLKYNSGRWSREMAAKVAERFVLLLEELFSADSPVNTFLRGKVEGIERGLGLDPDNSITALFNKTAAANPDATALVFGEIRITYGELSRRADRVGQFLLEKRVSHGETIAICFPRGIDAIVAMLGILKSGCAYLPLDPAAPAERNDRIAVESGAVLLLQGAAPQEFAGMSREKKIRFADIFAEDGPVSDTLTPVLEMPGAAYIIYTSGSTGKPKGVKIGHQNVINHVSGMQRELLDKFHRRPFSFCLLSHFIFDASVQGIFCTLLSGGRLIIANEEERADGHGIIDLYRRHAIDISDGSPAHLRLITQALEQTRDDDIGVRHLIIGGDVLYEKDIAGFRKHPAAGDIRITNVYGPTECTVNASYYTLAAGRPGHPAGLAGIVPIGKAFPGYSLLLLDAERQPVPEGIAGELFIGGAGVSAGYVDAGLDAGCFFENLFESGMRWYRTGDRAIRDGNGDLHFLRRMDGQVKINGYRIEIAEVRDALSKMEGIGEVQVKAAGAEPKLYAYYRGSERLDAGKCRQWLAGLLPSYMIPAYFIRVDEWPRLPSGKIDLGALPEKADDPCEVVSDVPETPLEARVLILWKDILKNDSIGVSDNFFNVGGDSIKLIKLLAVIRSEFNVSFKLIEIYGNESVRKMCRLLNERAPSQAAASDSVDEEMAALKSELLNSL